MRAELDLPVLDGGPGHGGSVVRLVSLLEFDVDLVVGDVYTDADDVKRSAVGVLYVGAVEAGNVEYLKIGEFHRVCGIAQK